MHKEQTLIILKPDAVQRSLVGKILERFENIGLKIVAMKMFQATPEHAAKHYKLDEEWAKGVYSKAKASYDKEGKKFPFKDHMEMGKNIQERNMKFLCESPVIAAVLQGPHAVELARKLIGSTEPRQALPGTIRGDFASIESYALTDPLNRVLRNLVHASDSPANAKNEITLWFSPKELFNYQKELDKHF